MKKRYSILLSLGLILFINGLIISGINAQTLGGGDSATQSAMGGNMFSITTVVRKKTTVKPETKSAKNTQTSKSKKTQTLATKKGTSPIQNEDVINQDDIEEVEFDQKDLEKGKIISLPKPPYPKAALAVRVSGEVDVQVVIDEEGNVVSAEAISGHPLLRAASVEAAKQAKFTPTLLKKQPVMVTGIIVYNFQGSSEKN